MCEFAGCMRASVGSEQGSSTTNHRHLKQSPCGAASRAPFPTRSTSKDPKVRTRKLPSLGRSAFHSSVIAPAELTTGASCASAATSLRHSRSFHNLSFTGFKATSAPRASREPLWSTATPPAMESSANTWARLSVLERRPDRASRNSESPKLAAPVQSCCRVLKVRSPMSPAINHQQKRNFMLQQVADNRVVAIEKPPFCMIAAHFLPTR